MKNLLVLIGFLPFFCVSQSIFGKWKTIDNETGEAKSTVTIYENNGKVYGKIIDIYSEMDRDALCSNCKGVDYNKPVLGLEIIKGLNNDGEYYEDGTIFDPERGKTYKCRLYLSEENSDILVVRGYVSVFYTTQYWERIN